MAAAALAVVLLAACDDPVAPVGADGFVVVAAGENHTCATGTDGVTYCWGRAEMNQLGNVSESDPCLADATACLRPLPVRGEPGFANLTLGRFHSCGTVDTEAFCWGYNQRGQLGDANEAITLCYGTDPLPCTLEPLRVALGYPITHIDAGPEHTCAVVRGGDAYCWGLNEFGQLGVGNHDNTAVPVRVLRPDGERYARVAAALSHTCGVMESGAAYCWGANPDGELGDGTRVWSDVPVRVVTDARFVDIDAARAHVCAIADDGAVYCWGFWGEGRLGGQEIQTSRLTPYRIDVPEPAVRIATGDRHTCAVAADGSLYCWGDNDFGQLGRGPGPPAWVPVETPLARPARAVAAGESHTCVIDRADDLWCWGANDYGQLGTGDRDTHDLPVRVSRE